MPDDARVFARLKLNNWRQFHHLEMDFHPRATLITGANATGKTTILALLARHFDWPRQWIGIPIRNPDGTFAFFLRLEDDERQDGWMTIGSLTYGGQVESSIRVPTAAPEGAAARYDLMFENQQPAPGLYLTSHRSVAGYAAVESIPTRFGNAQSVYNQFLNELRNRFSGVMSRKSPFAVFKESLISAAVFGEGSASVEADPVARDIWFGYQQVLAQILPDTLHFERLTVRAPEIIVHTGTGAYPLDESSGGLSALMELGWQIFLRSRDQERFLVLFDEPENHLHPELQRRIVPSLLEAFPGIQFIITTHSPFVVTSVPESNVFVLEYNNQQRVEARLLDQANKSASADETLRRVLGLQSTMPLWAEDRFGSILERYLAVGLSRDNVILLRNELVESGLDTAFPEAMVQAADFALRDES